MPRYRKEGETENYLPIEYFLDAYELELVEAKIVYIKREENQVVDVREEETGVLRSVK